MTTATHKAPRTIASVVLFLGAACTFLLLLVLVYASVTSGQVDLSTAPDTIAWAVALFGTAGLLFAGIRLIKH